jgi:hypothetical protein
MMENENSENEGFAALYESLQKDAPITFSCMSMIFNEFKKIANSLPNCFKEMVSHCRAFFNLNNNDATLTRNLKGIGQRSRGGGAG